jgi:hypothetical protein
LIELRLTLSEDRTRTAIEGGAANSLQSMAANIISGSESEWQTALHDFIYRLLAPELAWCRANDIECGVRMTESDRSFLLTFAIRTDAEQFQAVWGGQLVERLC